MTKYSLIILGCLLCSFLLLEIPVLVPKQVVNKRVSVLIPKDFTLMSREMIKVKYPQKANRPLEVFTNADASINIVFDHTQDKATQEQLPEFKKVFQQQFASNASIDYRKGEIRKINGRDFIIIEMVTPIPGDKIYNLMFITSLDGRLLLGTFNCTGPYIKEWQPIAEKIANSIKVL